MKKVGFWAALLAGWCWIQPLLAQVTVEVRLDQDQFLPGETVPVAVRITNRSGRTLHLGEEEDWLTFSVESRDGFVVQKTGDPPVAGGFELETSKTATKRVDIAPYFDLDTPGRYTIQVTVRLKDWDRQLTSPPKGFNVIQGSKLWEQEFGMPKSADATNAEPEVRKYILQQANYLKGQIRLYLRLTDASGNKAFRVFPVGQLVSFSRPDPQVDKLGNLHLLFANGPQSYNYSVFNPEGDLTKRQIYDYIGTRPRLAPAEEGDIKVVGGIRRFTSNDVPPSNPAVSPDATPGSKP
jgi:hypothetical protein